MNRIPINKEPLLPYPTRIPPEPLFDHESGGITSFSSTLHKKAGRNSYGDSGYPMSELTHTYGTSLATLPVDFNLFPRNPHSLGRPINSQMISSTTCHWSFVITHAACLPVQYNKDKEINMSWRMPIFMQRSSEMSNWLDESNNLSIFVMHFFVMDTISTITFKMDDRSITGGLHALCAHARWKSHTL